MCQRCHHGNTTDRRDFLLRTASALGAAGLAGLFPQVWGAEAAPNPAHPASATALRRALPAPLPRPGGGFLPGPEDAVTPFFGARGMGLDVDPSTITNFAGFTAFAVLAGHAEGSDGKTYNVESDLRVMEGEYVAEDGSRHQGTFAFF